MLEEVLRYINNRFDRDSDGDAYGSEVGTFTIENGTINADGLLEGQHYWVEGSVLNDGLHLHPDSNMVDEEFDGAIVFLRIPKAVLGIADEITAWNETNAKLIDSPLASESFGGYSYSKANGGSEGNEMPASAWQVHFGSRLRPYRKLNRNWV